MVYLESKPKGECFLDYLSTSEMVYKVQLNSVLIAPEITDCKTL